MTTKNCTDKNCQQINPQSLANFTKRSDTNSGFRSHCKICFNRWERAYRRSTPERLAKTAKKDRRGRLKRKYWPHLTSWEAQAEWDRLFQSQNGICAFSDCNNPATDVDHDHATLEVRGLLCVNCNTLLGKIEKRPLFITNAAAYLGKTL